jgi:hypothetical protein
VEELSDDENIIGHNPFGVGDERAERLGGVGRVVTVDEHHGTGGHCVVVSLAANFDSSAAIPPRLHRHCGDMPPVELEAAYYAQHRAQRTA